jgi:cytochrome c oxidase assembly protein subunit 15
MTTATIVSRAVSTSAVTGSDSKSHITAIDPLLRALTGILSLSCLFLIFVGGLVKSHEAGLSVPDWPTTYGDNMFLFPYQLWIGGIFYEHGHRLLASGVGLMTVIVAIATFMRDKRRLPRVLSIIAVLTVILQGTLGGLTVLYRLPPAISICHGLLAQSFFLITISLYFLQSNLYRLSAAPAVSQPQLRNGRKHAAMIIALLYFQLLAGAVMRHNGAGMALLDFPTMGGNWLPSISSEVIDRANALRAAVNFPATTSLAVTLHLIHRLGGFVVALAIGWLLLKLARGPFRGTLTHRAGVILGILTGLQIALGIGSILSVREPFLTSFHVAVGAAVLGAALWVLLSTFREKLID